MIDIQVVTDAAVRGLERAERAIIRAEKGGLRRMVREAKTLTKQRMSFHGERAPIGQLGIRSGQTRRAVRGGVFTRRSGEIVGRVYIRRDRRHIMRFNELGTKSHGRGGGPLPARRVLSTIQKQIAGRAVREIEQQLPIELRKAVFGF